MEDGGPSMVEFPNWRPGRPPYRGHLKLRRRTSKAVGVQARDFPRRWAEDPARSKQQAWAIGLLGTKSPAFWLGGMRRPDIPRKAG